MASQERPKIGLALSGGAAKGFAHIGVLQVLEEAGIRPDYITGTSMGSIIGGLYAMGYSSDSLAIMSKEQDWTLVLSDRIPLNEVNLEEKPFFRNQLVELSFRKGVLEAPNSLIYGQQIEELLSRLTLPTFETLAFDSLPIPFHCMAANIVTGEPVEISSGNLGDAMRASMAIPTIFSPVGKDSMVLVDGGLIRNFPVQEVKKMGADIVIGVYVGAQPKDADKLKSISKILTQIAFLTSIQDAEEQLPFLDVYIEPDLGEFGPNDFTSADTIIELGRIAAYEHFDELRHLADSINSLGAAPPPKEFNPPGKIYIDRIQVEGEENPENSEVLRWSGLRAGQTLTSKDLEEAVEILYGTNYYEKVGYVLDRRANMNILRLIVQEKAPILLKGSLIYDSYHEAGIAFNMTLRNLLSPASRLMVVGLLANNHRYGLSFLKYIGARQQWYAEAGVLATLDEVPIVQDGRVTQEFKVREFPMDIGLYRRFGTNMTLGAGVRFDFLQTRPEISQEPDFESLHYTNFSFGISFRHNNLNRNILPTHGNRIDLKAEWVSNLAYQYFEPGAQRSTEDSLFSFSPYLKLSFQSEHFLPLTGRSLIRLSPFLGILGNAENVFSDFYLVGAPQPVSRRAIPFYGLGANEMTVQIGMGSSFNYQYFFRENFMLSADLSAGFFAETEQGQDGIPEIDRFLLGAGVSATYNSLVGPFSLTIMYPFTGGGNVTRDVKGWLTFGHRF